MTKHPSRWRWAWIGWLLAFLLLEVPAALNKRKGGTLSKHVWRWFPTWGWWSLVAGLLLSLVGHLSPAHLTVIPVILFGAAFVGRVGWVELRRRE